MEVIACFVDFDALKVKLIGPNRSTINSKFSQSEITSETLGVMCKRPLFSCSQSVGCIEI